VRRKRWAVDLPSIIKLYELSKCLIEFSESLIRDHTGQYMTYNSLDQCFWIDLTCASLLKMECESL
jgi:hypothetical protein